jgi:hypothetical protein
MPIGMGCGDGELRRLCSRKLTSSEAGSEGVAKSALQTMGKESRDHNGRTVRDGRERRLRRMGRLKGERASSGWWAVKRRSLGKGGRVMVVVVVVVVMVAGVVVGVVVVGCEWWWVVAGGGRWW